VLGRQDILLGLGCVALGGLALALVRGIAVGTTARMGAGYVPTVLAWLMVALGIAIAAGALVKDTGRIEGVALMPTLLLLVALGLFAVLVERAGFVAAALAVILVSSPAAPDFRLRDSLVLALAVATAAAVLFVRLLGLPLRLWPT